MDVFDISGSMRDAALATAEETLGRGELVVLPTDTVYGLSARPDLHAATARLFTTKRRPRGLTLPVLVPNQRIAESVAVFDDRALVLAERFWPGGVTLVLPRTDAARTWDLGHETDTVGVRIPAHHVALALLHRTGPLAVTSANVSGEPTPPDCPGVRAALGDAVAVYLCAGRCAGTSSTVVDLIGPEVRVIRVGAVGDADIRAALGS
jgi:L-threonylcarbamoyladenylate synthase